MDKKTIIAIALSIAILFAWDYFVLKPQRLKNVKPQTTQELPVKSSPSTSLPKTAPVSPISPVTTISTPEEFIITNTPLFEAKWSTKGANLVSLKLKKYNEFAQKPNPSITELVKRMFSESTPRVKSTELVQAINTPMPGVFFAGGASDENLIFSANKTGIINLDKEALSLAFDAPISDGITLRKTFTVDPKTYLIGYKNTIINSTKQVKSLGLNVTMKASYPVNGELSKTTFNGPALLNGKHLEEFKLSKIKEPGQFRPFIGSIKWFGYEDTYFLNVIVPINAPEASLSISRLDDSFIASSYSQQYEIQPGKTVEQDLGMYIGPKEYNSLKSYSKYGLNTALSFGFFDIVAKPLLISMNWINKYVGSFGWSIIILTFIIKIILYPLSLKSFKSMKGLQKIQPLMKELQEKYKDDKQRQNQELMKLYKDHKINPMGGCLPLVLQIPILFALYKVFLSAIELRQTPFHIVGTWLPDLSAPDPYLITPLLMGASWFVQQKMTPTPGDAMQQKIMMFMPLIFTFMFLTFPSGLVIYWLISNILSIIQQAYINRAHV
jgi:YidC/Oxa1 family membrane protein insertase